MLIQSTHPFHHSLNHPEDAAAKSSSKTADTQQEGGTGSGTPDEVVAMVPQMSKMGAKENKHRLKLIIQEMNKPTSMGLGSCQSKTKKSKNVQENPHDGCKSLIRFGYDFASFVDASLDFMQLSHNVNWTALNLGTSSSSGLKKKTSHHFRLPHRIT